VSRHESQKITHAGGQRREFSQKKYRVDSWPRAMYGIVGRISWFFPCIEIKSPARNPQVH
jgi:hypothetical protein